LLSFLSPFPCMCVWRVGPKIQLHPNSTHIVYTMHYQSSQMPHVSTHSLITHYFFSAWLKFGHLAEPHANSDSKYYSF
jgi:hypothetical protein